MIAILIAVVIVLITIYALKTRKALEASKPEIKVKVLPGPTPLPIIGSAHLLGGSDSPFVRMSELSEKYGDIFSITIGTTKCVVVNSLETIKSVLLQNGKFVGGRPDFLRFHVLFGHNRQNSLALCDWSNLQVRRRNISRKFCDPGKYSPVKSVISDVAGHEMKELMSTLRIKGMESYKRGEDLKVKPIIMATALNLFSQYMCSTRFDDNDMEFQEVVKIFDNLFWEINQGRPIDFFPWLAPFYKKDLETLNDYAATVRKFILKRVIDSREASLNEDDKEQDFTDALLKALKHETIFTKEAILFTLEDFLGGSSALGNVVMLLLGFMAKHPKVAATLQKELDEVTDMGKRQITVFDVDLIPYTMAVINETLRTCSSPIVPHVAMETANVNGYTIEKGTVIMINNYKLNTDEKYWDNPKAYDPERFLEKTYIDVKNERRGSEHDSGVESENESNNNSKSRKTSEMTELEMPTKKEILTLKKNIPHFFPFSTGKRTCLGRNILMDFGMVTFTNIMQNFNISSMHPEKIRNYTTSIALPYDTYDLTITPRDL